MTAPPFVGSDAVVVAWSNDVVVASLTGLALAVPVAAFRAATLSGTVAGAACAAWFCFAGGAPALAAFGALVVGGVAASRTGRAEKALIGAAQEGDGRRSARHVLANAGPAAVWFGIGRFLFVGDASASAACDLAAAASLLASLSDTVAGEIGMLFRERPRLLLVGPIVPRGRDGGMTFAGTAVGLIVAALGGIGVAAARGGAGAAAPEAIVADATRLLVGAFSGCVVDSVLGATVERRLRLGNEGTNFLSSLCGGAVAFLLHGGAS